jgi:hypothetical protein
MSGHARPVLRAGRVYRTRDLARWSKSPGRLAHRLVREGTLQRISRGLYYAPVASRFGPAPAPDEVILQAVLGGDLFLISGPPRWNALGLGSTAMCATTLVFNSRRSGDFVLGAVPSSFGARVSRRIHRPSGSSWI